jgi:anti-sigma B factor antagonist
MPERVPITVNVEVKPSATILAPVGEIGYHEAPTLQQAIRSAFDKKPKRLIVNLTGVSYMATPGLATLVEALQIGKKSNTPLVLVGLSERVRAVFEIARLNTVFKIAADVDQALTT